MRSPEDLLRIGFQRSRIVIVNECHDGDRHCPRTRAVGRRLLPVAHEAGVRHLAKRYARELRELGGTGGFLRDEDPDSKWRNDLSADAWLLSLDNSMR